MQDGKPQYTAGVDGKGHYAIVSQFVVESSELTVDQEHHVEQIGQDFCGAMAVKYIKGQKEHGGNLFDMSPMALLDCAIEEAIDQVVYLYTLKRAMYDAGQR